MAATLVSTFLGLEAYCLIEILRHTGPLDFQRGTCAPSFRSQCSLSLSLQQIQPTVKLLAHWDWQNRESFLQRLRTLVPGHPSSHSALSSYGLFTQLALCQLSVCLQPLVQGFGSCPASWDPWFSVMPPSLGRGQVTTRNGRQKWFREILHCDNLSLKVPEATSAPRAEQPPLTRLICPSTPIICTFDGEIQI